MFSEFLGRKNIKTVLLDTRVLRGYYWCIFIWSYCSNFKKNKISMKKKAPKLCVHCESRAFFLHPFCQSRTPTNKQEACRTCSALFVCQTLCSYLCWYFKYFLLGCSSLFPLPSQAGLVLHFIDFLAFFDNPLLTAILLTLGGELGTPLLFNLSWREMSMFILAHQCSSLVENKIPPVLSTLLCSRRSCLGFFSLKDMAMFTSFHALFCCWHAGPCLLWVTILWLAFIRCPSSSEEAIM